MSDITTPQQTTVTVTPSGAVTDQQGGNGKLCVRTETHNGGTVDIKSESGHTQGTNGDHIVISNGKNVRVTHDDAYEYTGGNLYRGLQGSVVNVTGDATLRANRTQEQVNKAISRFYAARAGFTYNKNEIDLLNLDDIFNWDLSKIMERAWKAPTDFKWTTPQLGATFLEKIALLTIDSARFYAACAAESFQEAGNMFSALIEEKIDSLQAKYEAICKFGEEGVFKKQMEEVLKSGDPSAFFKITMNPAQSTSDLEAASKRNEANRQKEIDKARQEAQEKALEGEKQLAGTV